VFGIYIGINQNPSKSSKSISTPILTTYFTLIMSTHSSSSSLPSHSLPLIGISIAERPRDRGFDTIIRFDDSPKHPKPYRQISSVLAKIPSRDASPSDISNVHAAISERGGKLSLSYFNGSITASPIIETIFITL
jgi:F-type H+-transporting ATPase subunit alpha